MKEYTPTELAEMLRKSLAAQCHKVEDLEINADSNGVSVKPKKGTNTMYCVNSIFIFAEAFGLSAYIGLDLYTPDSNLRPEIRLS